MSKQSAKLPICWKKDNVGKAISIKAKIDEKQTHYFLASHSPMTHIQDESSRTLISEEDIYQQLTTSAQRDKQAVIWGEPGTGKSHLIHWLKLRYDYGLSSKEIEHIVPVLIERRSGSLKDALSQLIQQLGKKFQKYLTPVEEALDKLSDATARQMVLGELSLDLGPRREDRDLNKIDKRLKHLGSACRQDGFGGWLSQDDGVVHQTINLLTEASDLEDRENVPCFKAKDLLVKGKFKSAKTNSGEVRILIDELDDSEPLRERAAEYMNKAMKHSIRQMVGLSGTNLRNIFDSIRQDLATEKPAKTLVLFVEDVSAMSVLDVEIVNALEPQDRKDLCPLTAVLGMTERGWADLRDNQKQRFQFAYRVDGDTTEKWSQDKEALAKFTARYLNSIRLKETEVKNVAAQRRKANSDVQLSKCTDCRVKDICHETFGHVDIDGTEIGLYPFSRETAPRVLELIRQDDNSPFKANQRALLIRLLSPMMSDTESLEQKTFPNTTMLPVHVSDPYYWSEFQPKYLGDYSESERNRIRILAGLWIDQTDEVDLAATRLERFIHPLELPDFSKEAPKPEPTTETETKPDKATPNKDDKQSIAVVKRYIDALSSWSQGENLSNEGYFRDRLSELIRNSIRWNNHLQPAQFLDGIWNIVKGRGFISIEGQPSSPGRVYYTFPRAEETRALLEALSRYDKEGNKSWQFNNGEAHRRIVTRWVRKHEKAVVETLTPEVDVERAVNSAVQFLGLFAVVRDRAPLPQQSVPDLMDRLFRDCWEEMPDSISTEWAGIISNMSSHHEQILNFLKNEVAVRQGRGGINFVAPHRIVGHVLAFQKDPSVLDLPENIHSGFWATRFAGLPSLASPQKEQFANLLQAIEAERNAIGSAVNFITESLQSIGFETKDLRADFALLCDQVITLQETVKTAKVVLPNEDFDQLMKNKTYTEHKMRLANCLSKAKTVTDSTDPFDVLTFAPAILIECQDVIKTTVQRIEQLDNSVTEEEENISKDGNPEEYTSKMFDSLKQFAELNEDILEDHHVEAS